VSGYVLSLPESEEPITSGAGPLARLWRTAGAVGFGMAAAKMGVRTSNANKAILVCVKSDVSLS
jgi:hypothetical protein